MTALETSSATIRVLLVAHDPEDAARLKQNMSCATCPHIEVSEAATCGGALDVLRRCEHDLVLLDLSLPDSHNLEAFRRLTEQHPGIPIVVLTDQASEEDALRALEAGAQDYLVKDQINGRPLVTIVRYAIGRKRAERALLDSQKLHGAVLNSAMDAMIIVNGQWQVQELNPAALRMFGWRRSEILGKDLLQLAIPPAARERYRQAMGHYLREGTPSFLGTRINTSARRADGTEIIVEFSVTAVPHETHPLFCVCARDVTRIKEMERALEYERNLLRALIDSVPDHIYAKDTQGRFLVANAALARFFAVGSAAEIIGKTDADYFPSLAAGAFAWEEQQILRTGQPILNREGIVRRDPAKEQWMLSTKVPLMDSTQRIIGIVGVNRDITQHKRDQEQLSQSNVALADRERALLTALEDCRRSHEQVQTIQLLLAEAEKMELVGSLAAGVAHEVKNPLAIIAMGVDCLSQHDATATCDEYAAVLKRIQDAAQRADTVIRDLLDFSAPRTLHTQIADLNRIIEQSHSLLKHEFMRHHINWHIELAPDLPEVSVDVIKIEQVFVNLFLNAIHAMPKSGTLTVRTHATEPPGTAGDRVADPRNRGNRLVVVEVEDSGIGIRDELLPHVFDPFFTTKPSGQGTGLGLTVAKTIIEQHRGSIELRNRREGGVVVTLTFEAKGGVP